MQYYSAVSGETLTIRRTNPRTPLFIYVACVFVVALPIMYFAVYGVRSAPLFFRIAVVVFTALNLRLWGLFTKITIGPDGVLYKSPRKEILYPWSEIRTAGMYIQNGVRTWTLDRTAFNQKHFFKLKYVWFGRRENMPRPFPGFPGVDYCDFEFRQEAWELFNKYLVGNPDPNYIPGPEFKMAEPSRKGF